MSHVIHVMEYKSPTHSMSVLVLYIHLMAIFGDMAILLPGCDVVGITTYGTVGGVSI